MADVDMYSDAAMYSMIKSRYIGGLIMGAFKDRSGERFGKLVVIRREGTNALKKVLWLCKCDCGGTTVVPSGSLVTGNTTSCGCVIRNYKHGGAGKGSYNTWRAMMRRCYNKNDKDYLRYGGVGVKVCDRWHDYALFALDVGEPTGSETLDRIDPYGNYEPNNCRWASVTVQNRNVRVRKTSKSGYVGVYPYGDRWISAVTVKPKRYYSRVCDTLEEAVEERKRLEAIYWGNN